VAKKVGNRQNKTLKCSVCGEENYREERNVKNSDKLEISKYCSRCRKHTTHKEKK
jgi:large subunit ribosomal protein L33